ncbi:hypothetical protein AJ85_14375 [Alkalihalobacillus alcalophilus ATCC 27647 = CGMCC 1.3604]|uniref:Uncharacterized protein n=1 Tax=Alkalihalobacillus alcalophilus ATCC 27647 = CGMCC 1.3604 TaxID=1218173 RepID=A0A4S4JXH0_ALKAL|nr:hypothetical protein [Alkalihalobacillus alcalophilus]MED1561595.1 hypothetical protein [Alkalihalobacillus alcalophilus]THG89946.1 hypothetical protein AJ85_14375 [Alkalihalobacillus alcalophilus ATCC 27647 = CGMCC 1.3604]
MKARQVNKFVNVLETTAHQFKDWYVKNKTPRNDTIKRTDKTE